MSRPLGMLEFHHRDGTRVLVPAELVGQVREVPGNGVVPPQCRITLKGRSFYEAVDVVETIDEVAAKYAAVLAGSPRPRVPKPASWMHEHRYNAFDLPDFPPEAIP